MKFEEKYLRMKQYICLFFITIFLIGCSTGSYVQIGDNKIFVEVATTPEEQMEGLQQRESLEKESGMLFVWETEKNISMWMKDTLIPLDMIFIDSEKKIVAIQNAKPCKVDICKHYTADTPVQYVLEVNQGWSEKHNVQVGDSVEINIQ